MAHLHPQPAGAARLDCLQNWVKINNYLNIQWIVVSRDTDPSFQPDQMQETAGRDAAASTLQENLHRRSLSRGHLTRRLANLAPP
jgi:hypothetical protein